MKEKVLTYCINKIKKKYPNYDNDKIEIILYGLESLYITITKSLVIFGLAFIIGILKETFILLFFYNILRSTSFGLHAKKSSQCYIVSSVLFLGMALIIKYFNINIYIKIIISIFSFISIILYAPADTYKRPLLNSKKRTFYKIISIINSFIYLILIFIFNKNKISDYLLLGLLDASLMIHPLTYKVFHLPYNNYKRYN